MIKIDVADMTVQRLADMHYARKHHGMCILNGYVYVTGGMNDAHYLSSCERYSLERNVWLKDVPRMPVCIYDHNLVTVDGKWLYTFGGVAM